LVPILLVETGSVNSVHPPPYPQDICDVPCLL